MGVKSYLTLLYCDHHNQLIYAKQMDARTHTNIYALDGLVFEFRSGQVIFCSPKPSKPSLGPT
jgi:hypothetical protein